MATTALNIVQRLGGPTLTTLCATFLGWRLRSPGAHEGLSGAFASAFFLLCVLHALLFAAALRLPLSLDGPRQPEDEKAKGLSDPIVLQAIESLAD
jgi:hypothetical protein